MLDIRRNGGMAAATCFGVFVIPVLYVVVQGVAARLSGTTQRVPAREGEPAGP